jgi:hypothetical protein
MPRPAGQASRRRFCSETCRKAAWRQRQRDRSTVTDIVTNDVPRPGVVPTASRDEVPTPGGQHRCPHCRQPLAIISVVIPADAAVIKPPEVLPMTAK